MAGRSETNRPRLITRRKLLCVMLKHEKSPAKNTILFIFLAGLSQLLARIEPNLASIDINVSDPIVSVNT